MVQPVTYPSPTSGNMRDCTAPIGTVCGDMACLLHGSEVWLRFGWERGWCGPPVCATCDGVPATEDEFEDQTCIHVLRLYEDGHVARRVETEHAPSLWRASNRGWVR